jgi:translation initiation factor IF-3
VRLVGPNGEQVGIVRVEDALRLAQEADLDLVEVAPTARPPVCTLMDFGKFKYEAALKAREARKNQINTVIKEIKLRPKIDPHDYGTKKGHVVRFLSAGDKVKVTIMFRGREQSRPELGFRLLQRLAEDVVELGFVESAPKQDGRNMIMVLGPTKRKAEAKAEERRRKAEDAGGSDDLHDLHDLAEPVEHPFVANVQILPEPSADAPAPAAPAAVQPEPAAEPEPAVVATPEPVAPVAPEPPAPRATKAAAPRPPAPRPATPTGKPATPAAKPAAAAKPATPAAKPATPAAAAKPATPRPATPKPATPKPAKAATPKPPAPRPSAAAEA